MTARALAAWLVAAALGCGGGGTPEARVPPDAQPEPAALGPLVGLVPAGAELVLVARPDELLRSPAVSHIVRALVPPGGADAFARRTGVDPRRVEQAVVAEYDHGFVLIARGPFDAEQVVRAAARRMTTVETRSDAPFVRRAGYLGADRRKLAALRDDTLAVAGGQLADRWAALLSRAHRGRWPQGRREALSAPDATELHRRYGDQPLVLYAPRPLQLPAGLDASLLLARERALAAVLQPADPESLHLELTLRGEFPPGASDNFRELVESVARTDLGAALGLGETLETVRVDSDGERVRLGLRLMARSLARGLRMLFVADIEQLLDPPAASGAGAGAAPLGPGAGAPGAVGPLSRQPAAITAVLRVMAH